jgi:mannonate dehydratase
MPRGSKALRFEKSAFVAFDVFLLKRPVRKKEYTPDEIKKAQLRLKSMTDEEEEVLYKNALLGCPERRTVYTGTNSRSLKTYEHIDAAKLKEHLFYFLKTVVPVAEEAGLKMAIHPDDPPYPLLGLPRIVSTEKDAKELLDAAPLRQMVCVIAPVLWPYARTMTCRVW